MLNNTLAPEQYYGMSQQAVINGNFDTWQRGTSFVNPVNNQFITDRYFSIVSNTGTLPTTITHSKLTLTAGEVDSAYFGYRVNVNGSGSGFGAGDSYSIQHRIENGTRYLCGLGKKVTFSIEAKSDISGKKIGYRLGQNYGTGGSPSATEVINGSSFSLTSTATKHVVTFTTNTLVGKTFGTNNDDYLVLVIYYMWGSTIATIIGTTGTETFGGSGNIDIAKVKINGGDVAFSFQPKSPSQETLDCQRYAVAYTDANTSFPIGNGFALSTTQARIQVELPVSMRIAPTLTATAGDWQVSDGVTATDVTAISIVSGQSSNKTVTLLVTVASGLTQFRPYQLIADGTANRLMIFEAEL